MGVTDEEKQGLIKATSDVLNACGYDVLAKDCLREYATPSASIQGALNTWPNSKQKECLLRAQKLVGQAKWNVRIFFETGKKVIDRHAW